MKRPLLLLSNDDGVNAKGLNVLMEALRPLGDIVVVAPDGPRSGFAGAITSDRPLVLKTIKSEEGLTVMSCSGTPVDCVKLALDAVVSRKPDVVIGGINHGDNSSVNVHYSGTMGVVLEGCMKGIPAIGFSSCDPRADADFSAMLPYAVRITREVLAKGLPEGICLNVNAPIVGSAEGLKGYTAVDSLKGIRICRQTRGTWAKEWVAQDNPRGGRHYWLTGQYVNFEPEAEDTDHWAMDHGYVAITPTKIDVTAYEVIDRLKSLEDPTL
jgi:5'-nucleotidase